MNGETNPPEFAETPPQIPKEDKKTKSKSKGLMVALIIIGALIVIGVLVTLLFFYVGSKEDDNTVKIEEKTDKVVEKVTEKVTTPTVKAAKFASYEAVSVNVTPQVEEYTVKSDLSNVTNQSSYTFSDAAKTLLAKNAFVTVADNADGNKFKEFFPLYEENRYSELPSFITTDSILHNYHLIFDHILEETETDKLAPELKSLNAALLADAVTQYNALKGTEWENAAKRNVGFFAVGSKLLDDSITVPDFIKDEVDQELSFIADHQGIQISPLMNIGSSDDSTTALKEDYSQYVPRGHYTKSDTLKAYFKSMMWYGRLTFRFKKEDEIKSAALINVLLSKEVNQKSWDKLYAPINFFVGKTDDINFYQFNDVMVQVYGDGYTLDSVTSNSSKFTTLVEKTKDMEPPQINSMPIFDESINEDREEEIKGFRFMGQRFTIDAAIFQRLIYREVKNNSEGQARMLPKGLDVPAAMGSDAALDLLEEAGDTDYENYSTNMTGLRKYLDDAGTDTWTQNLYWNWMYTLRPLTEEKVEGYPSFMRNLAWQHKDLNTYLGNWTELKRDTILYAKQVYAEMGGGAGELPDDRGYVEPQPYVYARLASLIKMTETGLTERSLLTDDNKAILETMDTLVMYLKTISEKELNGEKLTDEEFTIIRSYGGQLEHIYNDIFKDEEGGMAQADLDKNPAPVVADVATDPNGFVLEEGSGYIQPIYVVFPIDGKLRIGRGGVFSYYEFPYPIADRLTDEKWRELLDSEDVPARPDWIKSFAVQ